MTMTREERDARKAQRDAETARLAEIAESQAKLDAKRRNASRWAFSTLVVFLSASITANVLSVELNPISVFIAVVAPVSLFASTKLLMVLGAIRNPWVVGILMTISVLIAGWSSYWHIVDLILSYYGNPWFIAYLTPIAMDVPMMMAGVVLSGLRVDAMPKKDIPVQKAPTTAKAPSTSNGHAKVNKLITV